MTVDSSIPIDAPGGGLHTRLFASRRILLGSVILLAIILAALATLPMTLGHRSSLYYNSQDAAHVRQRPCLTRPFGTDSLGRSLLGRCLPVGTAAALIAIILGVSIGLIAGYHGGWLDALLMRSVDVLYGLPYILLVILFKMAFQEPLARLISPNAANLIVLFSAIGLVSWLTMARVVRGQVLSLRAQPFIEAARAAGLPQTRIFLRHILPNLVGPVIVYATLTIPQAILQESFLSFLGIGIQKPMPTWGDLASDGLLALNPLTAYWWMLLFPCTLLAVTLLSLNFLGDGLRDVLDPRQDAAKL